MLRIDRILYVAFSAIVLLSVSTLPARAQAYYANLCAWGDPTSATFTAGSPNIYTNNTTSNDSFSDARACAFNFSGVLPPEISPGVNYWQVADNSGVSIQVSAAPFGVPIVPSVSTSGIAENGALLISGVPTNVAQLQIPAGTWDCNGLGNYVPMDGVTTSKLVISVAPTPKTIPSRTVIQVLAPGNGDQQSYPTVPYPFTGPTTVYGNVEAIFSGGVAYAAMNLRCRQVGP